MHTCQLLVISCLDYRFQEALSRFLNQKGFRNNYDLVCLAGAAGSLVSFTGYRKKTVLEQVRISRSLHRIKKVYLINHQNCGAYGEKYPSGSQKERERHEQDLRKARKIVKKMFPEIEVFTFFLNFANNNYRQAKFTAVR